MQVLDKGFVEFVDSMGEDLTPAHDARISTGTEAKTKESDVALIRYLLRHKHTSCFEGVVLKFRVKAPILVIREWNRHRTQSFSEQSGRYQQLAPDYYLPSIDRIAKQATTNRQGSGEPFSPQEAEEIQMNWEAEQSAFEAEYCRLVEEENVAKELARLNMPVSHYSTFLATANLLNWFRFLQLRMAPGAQYEIRMFANAIGYIIKEKFPICWDAFEDYWLNAMTFSAKEINALRTVSESAFLDQQDFSAILKGRELDEFKAKLSIICQKN